MLNLDPSQQKKAKEAIEFFTKHAHWDAFFQIEVQLLVSLRKKTIKVSDPSYALKSAYRDGQIAAIEELINNRTTILKSLSEDQVNG